MATSTATYDRDVIAWSKQQASLLRAGRFAELDIEHIADEVEDVGKSEQRELETRMALLLAHLLKWQLQPARRGVSWELTLRNQRIGTERRLTKTPSLKSDLGDDSWWQAVWADAVDQASKATGLIDFPASCPWTIEQILDQTFFPD